VNKKQFSVGQIVAVSKQAELGMPATTYSPDCRATSDFSADYHQQNLAKNPNLYCGIGGSGGLDAGGIRKARAKTADRSELHRDSAI
jgi:peptide methionine sulfoxide reductase MsrA